MSLLKETLQTLNKLVKGVLSLASIDHVGLTCFEELISTVALNYL